MAFILREEKRFVREQKGSAIVNRIGILTGRTVLGVRFGIGAAKARQQLSTSSRRLELSSRFGWHRAHRRPAVDERNHAAHPGWRSGQAVAGQRRDRKIQNAYRHRSAGFRSRSPGNALHLSHTQSDEARDGGYRARNVRC